MNDDQLNKPIPADAVATQASLNNLTGVVVQTVTSGDSHGMSNDTLNQKADAGEVDSWKDNVDNMRSDLDLNNDAPGQALDTNIVDEEVVRLEAGERNKDNILAAPAFGHNDEVIGSSDIDKNQLA